MGVIYKNGNYYGGGGGASYTAGDGIDITNDVISTDNLQEGDMSDIVTPLPSIPTRGIKYSTDEQVIGEWITGKPLYQKTISIGALPNNTTKTVNHNISNIGVCVNLFGVSYASSTGLYLPLPYTNVDSVNNQTQIELTSTEITIKVKTNFSGYDNTYITLQYTKTTD